MTGQESATHTPVSSSPRQCCRQPTTSEIHHARDSTTTPAEGCVCCCTSPCASLCVLLCCPQTVHPTVLLQPQGRTLQSYKDYSQQLPAMDCPEAFGQHPMRHCSQIRGKRYVQRMYTPLVAMATTSLHSSTLLT